MVEYTKKRNSKNVNFRNVLNLCPSCFSRLEHSSSGESICTGDRLAAWQSEVDKFLVMSKDDQQKFLESLGNESGFLNLINRDTGKVYCSYNSKISPIMQETSIRMPDPLAVSKLERKLKRELKGNELEEGYVFDVDGKPYILPIINFPEDV